MQRRTFINLGLVGLGTTFTMAKANPGPLQYIPKPSKEKWAILFGTWCGTARDASIWISEGLGGIASVYDIRQKPDLSSFDHLIIGTAIHGGKGPKELDTYLQSNASELKSKIRGLFAVCGNLGKQPGPPQKKDYIDNYLAQICQVQGVPSQIFGGRITKALLSPEDNKVVEGLYKSLNIAFEDYDNLSRLECITFGKKILGG